MDLPLAHRRIVVTRAAGQATGLLERLRAAGAESIALPTIAFAPPLDPAPLDAALRTLAGFDGAVFTSANSVAALGARARMLNLVLEPPHGWICALGAATAQALAQLPGWPPALVPAAASAEAVLAALADKPLAGRRVFLPRSAIARELLPAVLSALGAELVSPIAYRTLPDESSRASALSLFPGADGVIFTSPSTAQNLALLLGPDHPRRLRQVAIAVIGPTTQAAVTALGWQVSAVAAHPDASSLVAVLEAYWRA
ncbi:MAG: uroporphyrinogen-III synthase [Terriglobales bacterium]